MVVEPGQQFVEVGGGELPGKRPRSLVLAGLEGVEAVDDDVEVGESLGESALR
ncbi:hypothetical protein [Mycobacterium heckeshornense]|uniref:hypothetical protein n=1 Tax=Mycobacterium heckeshornense TaxID=110505 RepID=UPI001F2290A5|nr:hypothetical protein [Mycobacterium heckeshornense]